MSIVDGRTLLSDFESVSPVDLSGATSGTADTEIFIEGARSFAYVSGSTRAGLMYDAGSAQDWSNNTFYLWVNCGVAGLLNTWANGGLRVRFAGASAADYFEVNIAGSDLYPSAVEGGWVMLVVDIERARSDGIGFGGTGGTPPATTAIRYVGISTQTPTMPRMVDNTWLDAIWRLPASTPGIRVEGINGGSPWTWADIRDTAEAGAWGTAKTGPGGSVAINTPIQFGANDAVAHSFLDTNTTVLWEDWRVATSFYGLTVIGGSSTQSFVLGVKTGTGTDATGAQGCVIQAAPLGARWFFDCGDANIDVCDLFGCTFIHGATFILDSVNVSSISNLFIDCTEAFVDGAEILRCSVIDANSFDGFAFMYTTDMSTIVKCSFEFSNGHAIQLDTPLTTPQSSVDNTFTGYAAIGTTDAAIYNQTGGAVTINVSGGTTPTYRNGAGASTVVNATVTFSLTNVVANSRLHVVAASGGTLTPGDIMIDKALITTDPYNGPSVEANQPFRATLANASVPGSEYKRIVFEDNTGSGFARRIEQILDR